jgi:hypothetical protein
MSVAKSSDRIRAIQGEVTNLVDGLLVNEAGVTLAKIMAEIDSRPDCLRSREYADSFAESGRRSAIKRILRGVEVPMRDGRFCRKYHSLRKFTQSNDGREVRRDVWLSLDAMSVHEASLVCRDYRRRSGDLKRRGVAFRDHWNSTHPRRQRLLFSFDE